MKGRAFGIVAVSAIALTTFLILAFAGSLDPPASPAPTMKPLDDVEPRIPIRAADLPLTITASGNYYLAEDITTSGGGIGTTKGVVDVTIDMMGHTLTGGTGTGISNVTKVLNGTVKDWEFAGVSAAVVQDVHATGNGTYGIIVGRYCVRCSAAQNGSGISLNGRVTVVNSQAISNDSDGFVSSGAASHLRDCMAVSNGGDGFKITSNSESVLIHNIASYNDSDGIEVDSYAFVYGNQCRGNSDVVGQTGAGIHVIGFDNRIEGNNIRGGYDGITVDSAGNLIIGNTVAAASNATFTIAAGNTTGTIVTNETDMNNAGNALVNIEY